MTHSLNLEDRGGTVDRRSYVLPSGQTISAYFGPKEDQLEFVELSLAMCPDPELLEPEDYAKTLSDFAEYFHGGVREAIPVLGTPSFYGKQDDPGFPEDQEAILLAMWELDDARLMLEEKHEDQEVPIRLTVVVAPPTSP